MNFSRKDVETAIFSETSYTRDELAEMDVDELEFIAGVLGHLDTNLDTDELQAAITDLTN